MKHTEGPWTAGRGLQVITSERHIASCKQTAYGSAGARAAEQTWREDEANARLIAAAPEMLETLVAALDALQNMSTTEFQHGADRPIRERIESVLAKATGDV